MQSDTIIGIVGAVVLVAVMIGVFAYEYNNVPEEDGVDPDSAAAKMESFNMTYSALAASEDMDGDGVLNYEDEDLDGDGIPNDEDDMLMVNIPVSGTVAAPTPTNTEPTSTFDFTIGTGVSSGTVTITWSVTQPNVALPAIGELQVSIGGEDNIPCDNASTTEAVCDLAGAAPGDYTITVRHASAQSSAGQSNSYSGDIEMMYFS